jgi:hypothetical protein
MTVKGREELALKFGMAAAPRNFLRPSLVEVGNRGPMLN